MKVKIRRGLDLDKPINLKRLSPGEKIKAGLLTQWRQTKFYQMSDRKRKDAAHVEQVRRQELLRSSLLAQLYGELTQNNTLKSRDAECVSTIVEVQQDFEDCLKFLLPGVFKIDKPPHKDFLPFDIVRVKEHEDFRKAFSNMPILLSCSKKTL